MLGLSLGLDLSLQQRLSLKLECFPDFISKPSGICPTCRHDLTDKEIRKGFNSDPIDIKTMCPKCGTRFTSQLIIEEHERDSGFKVDYLCEIQTLHRMSVIKHHRGKLGIRWLSDHYRPLYYNIVRHFGTYENGLKELKNYG